MDSHLFDYLYQDCQLPYKNASYCVALMSNKIEELQLTETEDMVSELLKELETKDEAFLRVHLSDAVYETIDLDLPDRAEALHDALTRVDIPVENEEEQPQVVFLELVRLGIVFITGVFVGVLF